MAEATRLLILGGTGEAAALAVRLARRPGLAVTTSLAGRTRAPAAIPGKLRSGGFGGAEGLAGYLRGNGIDLLIDATHPFAARMSGNATAACAAAGVPRLVLTRPPWQARADDRWIRVPSAEAAAASLPELGRRVFLSTGQGDLAAFSGLAFIWFLVRLVEAPSEPVPLARYELILGRGPFTAEHEVALLETHDIAAMVSKNSGGLATYGKIEAARRLGIPTVMIDRPPLPEGETVYSVDDAVAWIEARRRPGGTLQ